MSDYRDGFDASAPRRRRAPADALSHFAIVEREGKDPDHEPARDPRPVNSCRRCPAEGVGMMLHQDPDDENSPYRTVCGNCQGAANLRRYGIQPRSER
jgi:hypothetical protein